MRVQRALELRLLEDNLELVLKLKDQSYVKIIKGEQVQSLIERDTKKIGMKVFDLVIVEYLKPLSPKVMFVELGFHDRGELLDKFFGTIAYVGRVEPAVGYAFSENLWRVGLTNSASWDPSLLIISLVSEDKCEEQSEELKGFNEVMVKKYKLAYVPLCCKSPLKVDSTGQHKIFKEMIESPRCNVIQ